MTRVHLPLAAIARAPAGGPPPHELVDALARRVRYLRVSVTDRCNYRCTYCMPEELASSGGLAFAPRTQLLTFDELERVVRVFARLGVRKLRLTGGEPTVRARVVDLTRRLVAIAGIEQVVMTTNGHILAELAAPLAAAGLTGVNVSLDTLDADRFHAVTGGGELARVHAGIDAAIAAGLAVKTNAVALRGVNDDQLADLCRDAWARGATPRFIEHMPMSSGALYGHRAAPLTAAEIRRVLEAELGPLAQILRETDGARDAGPARYWTVGDASAGHQVGIISAMTEHFCDDCNRVRLTATGDLHACLGHDDAINLRDIARGGGSDDDLAVAIGGAVTGKRPGHEFDITGGGGPTKHMIGIGG